MLDFSFPTEPLPTLVSWTEVTHPFSARLSCLNQRTDWTPNPLQDPSFTSKQRTPESRDTLRTIQECGSRFQQQMQRKHVSHIELHLSIHFSNYQSTPKIQRFGASREYSVQARFRACCDGCTTQSPSEYVDPHAFVVYNHFHDSPSAVVALWLAGFGAAGNENECLSAKCRPIFRNVSLEYVDVSQLCLYNLQHWQHESFVFFLHNSYDVWLAWTRKIFQTRQSSCFFQSGRTETTKSSQISASAELSAKTANEGTATFFICDYT